MTDAIYMIRHPTSYRHNEPMWISAMRSKSFTLFTFNRVDGAGNYLHDNYYWGKSSVLRLKCR